MSTAQKEAPKKGIYDWLSTDHAPECIAAKTQHERDAETLKKQGKLARPFACIGHPTGCCPDDLIINAGGASVIIGAQAMVPNDSPRLDVGDRREGAYYLKLLALPGMTGLQQVKRVPMARLAALDKIRKQRNGEMPADWIMQARARAAAGQTPTGLETPTGQLSPLQRAAAGLAPE